ncbi:Hsp20 family protein [Methylobacterium trifolii]|uniref:Small heat shock protein IbpA n=1 Tax=Methylobacterium trifolii TaxID=1003092 RepID=A0ABQ4TYN5_9HYPH|nr:Hsp20 family protein [Methylobacterium trifolii]GJE59108.1 Small heat shock protein IbpA [Methylobacterium trifolii]
MRTFDFAPLYRSSVGFDRLFDLMDQATRAETSAATWPPYNIEKLADDAYRITLAVAGFAADEIELTQNGNTLLVSGQRKNEGERQFLHRGIAARQFRQTFNLADHVKVTGAGLDNGLLSVELVREVPEAFKPRRIPIGGASSAVGQDNAPVQVEDRAKAA